MIVSPLSIFVSSEKRMNQIFAFILLVVAVQAVSQKPRLRFNKDGVFTMLQVIYQLYFHV